LFFISPLSPDRQPPTLYTVVMSSQLRKDLVSGDWIAIAPNRSNRPGHEIIKNGARKESPLDSCPFEDPQRHGNKEPYFTYGGQDWSLQVLENKFPAFTHEHKCVPFEAVGPFTVTGAAGHHDLVITRGHDAAFAHLSAGEADEVLKAFQERYSAYMKDECLAYVSMFQNWGLTAGASIYHPHYQMMALPVIPPDVMHSLNGSELFFQKHGQCVHCAMLEWECGKKIRIVHENEHAVAYAPFVSKNPYETRIFPKVHSAYFEDAADVVRHAVAETLQQVLRKMHTRLGDPDYNFFIHTSPMQDKERYSMYHWHVEIIPKVTRNAGFEFSTGVEINDVDPDDAAALLNS